MPPNRERHSKKPSGARLVQPNVSGSSSRFGKRQASEGSQGWTVAESQWDSSSSTNGAASVPTRSFPQYAESSISSGGEDQESYSSRAAVRLVNTQTSQSRSGVSLSSVNALEIKAGMEAPESMVQSPETMSPQPSTPSKLLHDKHRSTPTPSGTTTSVPSASRVHWNQLRNAIIPGASIPQSRPLVAHAGFPQSAIATAPPRPQTPKPSRFPRLGFRQVVDQSREILHEEIDRFEADIYQVCVAARFGEARQKAEREGYHQGYLPFMSATSLPLSATTTASQSPRSTAELIGRTAPSLKLLHETLMRYASTSGPTGTTAYLPYESEILSVLLIPFTVDTGIESEERWLAVETFEIASKTWRASSQQCEVDRVLWCCKAGLIHASPVRSRVLGALSNLLFSSTPLQDANPLALQNTLQGLQLLLYAFSAEPRESFSDTQIVRELSARVLSGACGQVDISGVEEQYGAERENQDTQETILVQIAAEGVVRCMQSGSEGLRRWVLHESAETYWPPPSGLLSPLCKKIVARRLNTFLQNSLSLLRLDTLQANPRLLESDSAVVVYLLRQRALAELEQLPVPKQMNDSRALTVELLFELLSMNAQRQKQQVTELICNWCSDVKGWRESLEIGIRLLVERTEWTRLADILQGLVREIPNETRQQLISIALPALHTRLVADPAPYPSTGLTSLLQILVQLYPQQFYKPLLGLAGASKDSTTAGQLGVVTALARHLPNFWIRDPEMVSIALMSDMGVPIGKGKAKEGEQVPWAKARIGQSLMMLELICCIKDLTKQKKDPTSLPDGSQTQAYRFAIGLEARLAILLEAKEKGALVPFSQRILLSLLFLEIRLFTRSLKAAPWLPRIVTWATQSYPGASLGGEENPSPSSNGLPQRLVGDEAFDEVIAAVGKIQSLHVACWQPPSSNSRQRSTMVLSPPFDSRTSVVNTVDQPKVNADAGQDRDELLSSLSTGVASVTLRLLVAVCALLNQADHRTLCPVLWSRFLDDADPRIAAPACFLMTYCLEKSPKDAVRDIENGRNSPHSEMRQAFIRRLMTLFAWRSQLLSQTYIYDRSRRRPFKLARQPIAFVAIDVGSGNYVHEQTEEDRKNHPGGTLPFELRKRLAEVGWEQDDQPTDSRLEKIRAPISLFPASQLDHLNATNEQTTVSPSRSAATTKQLLRRKSSASGHLPGAKRRPVFVPALVSLYSSVALLAIDPDPVVASSAREAILLVLRDDPAMLCRSVMDTLSTDLVQVGDAMSVLRAFLHVHHRLPPSASHHIFSHLGGFLKHASRESDDPNALRAFAYTLPILAKLITQVSSLTIRDLRRAKFEMYVFPSGSLWFPSTAPPSTMFPQSLGHMIYPFDELPPQLVGIYMIRMAQNMLLFDMLKHQPQEVHVVRKSLTGLVLPGENTGKELDAHSFIPRRSFNRKRRRTGYQQVSLALSRSYLLLLAQVFRSMSRNFNGKAELARLFDGINRILLAHGDDIGIITHALIACMVGITRFKRLVSSSGGFTLFMPSLLKVYAEAEAHSGIRYAIQYASGRFYAIHQDAYLFQSLDLASNILVKLEHSKDQDWFATKIWHLFSALKAAPHRSMPDAAGIRDTNRVEEREALIATTVTDEAMQTGTQESPRGEQLKKILAVGQYESKLLQLDDLVRLFLTVIAHDPAIMRAQNFLTLLRRMAPDFYHGSSSTRVVLRDGINALCVALFAKAPRQKGQDSNQGRPLQHGNAEAISQESYDGVYLFDDPSSPCDHTVMRREYLGLVVAFTRLGGDLRHGTIQRALDLVKGLLKESARSEPESEGLFLQELTESFLSRLSLNAKQALVLLHDVAPVIRAFALTMDCSGVLDTIAGLFKRQELANNATFVQFVVEQVAGPVLEASGDAAAENLIMSLPIRRSVVSLISHAAALGNADVVAVIEKQAPSPGFLAGIVLPLCLTIKTSVEIAAENQFQSRERAGKHGLIFARLLAYAMEACCINMESENGRSSPLPTLNRRESQRSKHSSLSTSGTPLATLTIVVQIIKVIVTRAVDDLSSGLLGIWARLARFLQQLLEHGDARFALPSNLSPTPSPWQSPKLSPSHSNTHGRTHSLSSDNHDPSSPSTNLGAPRVVDYLTWSLLEFLCCAPSPLTLQMRLWTQEKVHNLDMELKAREVPGPSYIRRSRRLSSSVFARARGSSASPDALRASRGFSSTPSELNLSASTSTDFTAYSRFPPPSPGSLQPTWTGPRIIHLGPTKDDHMFQPMERSSSQDSDLKNLARNSYIGLPSLIRMTYSRIRLVQTCMGYDRLLSMEGQGNDFSEINLKAWSKASALALLAEEAKLLMEEFRENFHETVGGEFIDVPANPGPGSPQASPGRKPLLF